MEFGVFGDLGLEEDCGLGGVETGGQEVDGDLQGVFGDGGGVGVVGGEGVPVSYEIEAFVGGIGLELDPVLQGAEIVANVETSGGAHAGDDSICGDRQVFASVELGDSLQFTDWERKRKNGRREPNAETLSAQRRGLVLGTSKSVCWLPWSLHSAAGAPNCGAEEKTGRSGRDDNSRKREEKRREKKSGKIADLDRRSPPFPPSADEGWGALKRGCWSA